MVSREKEFNFEISVRATYYSLCCRNANEELKDAVSSDEEEKLAVDSVKEEEEDTQSEYREGRQLLHPSLSPQKYQTSYVQCISYCCLYS